MHKLKFMYTGKLGFLALKLDMSKTCDRVEWVFVCEIMLKLGFVESWVKKIWNCISSISVSVLINGDPCVEVSPQRVLRQGCPLSPYLFILYVEGLSGMIRDAERRRAMHARKVARGSLVISHLFFTDDNLLFSKASCQKIMEFKRLLFVYEVVSGQVINYQKFTLSFSPNVNAKTIESIKNIFGISVVSRYSRYLGPPSSLSRNCRDIFTPIVNRVSQQVAGWKEKLFFLQPKRLLLNL